MTDFLFSDPHRKSKIVFKQGYPGARVYSARKYVLRTSALPPELRPSFRGVRSCLIKSTIGKPTWSNRVNPLDPSLDIHHFTG
jgi:hypothetical protein